LEADIMKKYLIPTIGILLVLTVAWAAFAQQERRGGRQLSEEERARMRERFQNMSEEEREKFREQMRARGGFGRGRFMSPEEQEKVIKVIQGELAKLKAAQYTRPEGGFRDLSEDERAKLREKMMKVRQVRQQALQTIIAQVAMLQGRRGPAAEGEQYLIINTADLKPIQAAAKKEKAEETSQLLQNLIARGSGRGFGGRPGTGQRPQEGRPGDRGSRTPGGQRGGRQRNR
jgi:hypothetical protein